jgi:tetratricopeptide (TPR) repeat protein
MDFVDVAKTVEKVEVLLASGNLDQAESLCKIILSHAPEDVEALFLLGNCAARRQDWDIASDCFATACRLAPDKPVLWKNLGYARQEQGDLIAAAESLRHALALDQRDPVLWCNLASLYVADYAFDQAATCYRRALGLGHEDPAELLNRLATLQVYLGETDKALEIFAEAIRLAPVREQQRLYTQNRLFTLHYPAGIAPDEIALAHRQWGRNFFQQPDKYLFANIPDPRRRLKVGYVSPDFRMNAVCFFIQPVLVNHDAAQIEAFCYANVTKPDDITRRLQDEYQDHWRVITGLNDEQASHLIRQDGIDILVDLTGHGGDNRLSLFALKPAPVQMTWIGYPDTTGLTTIDYRITDAIADPPGMTERLHTEELLRLPGCFLCYNPGAEFPDPNSLPFKANGFITFGSMSNFSKITPQLLDIWSEVLLQTPGSRLILRYRGQERERIARDIGQHLEQKGVTADRLELLGHASSVVEQLTGYNRMDIALDTFPYNGTTTTCEALWMGVPVLSLAGQTHVARVGASLLTAVGLPALIAESAQEYVEKAVTLANNIDLLDALRSRLRGMVSASPLCDHLGFTRRLEETYRMAWTRWCDQQNGATP